MEFQVLGPTAVLVDGQGVRLGPARRVTLLCFLILEANRPVSSERILEALAVPSLPTMTRSALHSHIAQLRKALGPPRLRSSPRGYWLEIGDRELDAGNFETDVSSGQAALKAGDPVTAALDLERALARWRGPALVDAGGAEWASAEADRLTELHVLAEETLLDIALALGQCERVIGLARDMIRSDPRRQSVWASLMLALYRSGRVADAVSAYQAMRTALIQAGDAQPSAELVKLERAMLLGDPSLDEATRPKVLTSNTMAATSTRVLPGGVLTFLMTDVVGSTRLWETNPAAMRVALARHDELMSIAVESHDGVLLRERGEGDSTFSVFRRATDAAAAALAAQLSLTHEVWPPGCTIQVRMAMHTGEASERDGDYYGRPVNRVARLRALAEGGQILVGQSAAEILLDHLPAQASLIPLGVKELRDLDRPETVYLLGLTGSTRELPATPRETAATLEATPEAQPEETLGETSWFAFVDADPEFYQHTGDKEVVFPRAVARRVIPLTDESILIGRPSSSQEAHPQIDLSQPFEDPGVSRTHAIFTRRPDGGYDLVDPGSTNGTFLNNMEYSITPRVQIPLSAGDCIYLGLWTKIEIDAQPGPPANGVS